MRIWGSQRSHFPLHRSVFCFRFLVSFVSPSAIVDSVLFCRPESTPSSPDRSLNKVRSRNPLAFAKKSHMTIGERHKHWSTSCAYEGVNGVTFRFIAESFASVSAGSDDPGFDFELPLVSLHSPITMDTLWIPGHQVNSSGTHYIVYSYTVVPFESHKLTVVQQWPVDLLPA
jgi:hypothetical protein